MHSLQQLQSLGKSPPVTRPVVAFVGLSLGPMLRRMMSHGANRSRQRNGARPSVHLRTSSWAFALWWLGLLLLHGANLAYYVGVALLYTMFDNTYLGFQLATYGIGLPASEYPQVSTIHACVAALHAFFILLMVVSSVHARKLVFQPETKTVYWLIARTPWVGKFLSRLVGVHSRHFGRRVSSTARDSTGRTSSGTLSRRVSDTVSRTGSLVFARDGLLGVDSVYFDHILIVREIVETALQTYQLYRMTLVLPRLWLIRFYVVLLVGNCWAVPFLHRYYRDRETTRRMLCLLCDAVLDMVSSIGVSVVIFATYAPQYVDPQGFGFSFITWFDDEWIASMQQEFQMMLVASWGDLVSRLVFALGLLQCMDAIKDMLTPVATLPQAGPPKQQLQSPSLATVATPAQIAPDELLGQTEDVVRMRWSATDVTGKSDQVMPPDALRTAAPVGVPNATATKQSLAPRTIFFVVHIVGPVLFVLWGLVILIVHFVAESHHATTACSLPLQPWFSRKPGCALVEINCAALSSTGHDVTFEDAWDVFDPDRVARLVIRHCPELRVSSRIRQFHTMSGFKVYNSTIVSWGDDAALTEMDHANMRMVVLLRTILPNGELPVGLLSTQFPKRMTNFFTAATNLKALPTNLDVTWPRAMLLVFETSLLTEIPNVVVRMEPDMVSMAGSPISVVQRELVESPNLTVLQIGLTNVQVLPRNVQRMNKKFTVLLMQRTNVTLFPSYLNAYAQFIVRIPSRLFNAYGSPYCRELDEIVAGTRSAFSMASDSDAGALMDVSTPAKLAFVRRAVDCSGPGPLFYFPLPLEDRKHALRK